jgi:hypothetical protein
VSAHTVARSLLHRTGEEADIIAVELDCPLALLAGDGVTVTRGAGRERAAGALLVDPASEADLLEQLKSPVDRHETQPAMPSLGALVQLPN